MRWKGWLAGALLAVPLAVGTPGTLAVPAWASESGDALAADARKILRSGSDSERMALAARIRAENDVHAALRVAMDALDSTHDRLAKGVTARDKQGQKLFKAWRNFTIRTSAGLDDYADVKMAEIENEKLCAAVEQFELERRAFVDVLRERSREAGSLAEEQRTELVDRARSEIARGHADGARATWIDALDGPLLAGLGADLHEWAVSSTDREQATAALRALARRPELASVARLAPCAEQEDAVIRRTFYRLLARVADVPSLDLLVQRLEPETGIPRAEILALLRTLAPSDLGTDPRPWASWWSATRKDWTPPEGIEHAELAIDGEETSRYFGLRLRSKRILFILDVSFSMDWPLDTYSGPDGRPIAGKGTRKIEIAKRELKQALDSLDESVSFNVLAYGTDLDFMNRRPVPADARNLKRARTWIDRVKLQGSTNLSGALLEGFENTRPSQPVRDAYMADTIVVLTDGEPNGGPIVDSDQLLVELRRLDPHRMVRIHTVFLGLDGKVAFMQSLATQSGGQFVHHKP